MVFRKKSKEEKEIVQLEKRIRQTDDQIDVAFRQAKDYANKDEAGKSTQTTTRWAILIDKRKIMLTDLERLKMVAPGGEDKTLKFEKETAEKFYDFLMKTDTHYLIYCWLVKKKPKMLEDLKALSKGVPVEQMVKDLKEKGEKIK